MPREFNSAEHCPIAQVRESYMPDAATLAQALAADVARQLGIGIAERGRALIALSGGTTPVPFLRALAQCALDWSRITVTLVDERWVPEGHPRSNARLIRENLLHGAASAAEFISLYVEYSSPEAGLESISARVARLNLPFDAVVLGMGTDGHCASFFPGSTQLAAALDPASDARVLAVHALAAGEPRISLTLATILATRHLYLHFEGTVKHAVFAAALAAGASQEQYPIRAVVSHARVPIDLYWCPQ